MDEPAGSRSATPESRDDAESAPGRVAEPGTPPPAPESPVLRRIEAPSQRVVLLVLTAAVVGVLLWLGREALGPFVVGLMLVYLLIPPVEWLSRARVPRWLAILLVYALVVLVVVEGLNLTLRPLVEQIRAVIDDLPQLAQQLEAQLERIGAVYRGLELPPQVREAIDGWLQDLAGGKVSFDPAILLPIVRATTTFLGGLVAFLIIPVWAFYLIKDRPQLAASFDRALPAEWREEVAAVLAIIERVFSQWVRGQLILGLAVGLATFFGLLALGAFVNPIFGRYAVLLAVIAGILELLPIIGPIIASIPAILLAATTGLESAGAALLLYLAVQQLENNLLVPKIQGDAIELHPSAVMFALVVGGAIAGLLGAILSLPITAAGRDVYRYLFAKLSEPVAVAASQPSPATEPADAGL